MADIIKSQLYGDCVEVVKCVHCGDPPDSYLIRKGSRLAGIIERHEIPKHRTILGYHVSKNALSFTMDSPAAIRIDSPRTRCRKNEKIICVSNIELAVLMLDTEEIRRLLHHGTEADRAQNRNRVIVPASYGNSPV